MNRCEDCRNLFEDGEEARWEERHGLDSPPYERRSGCPVCKGSFMEIEPCLICSGTPSDEYIDGELPDGICKDCFIDGLDSYYEEYIKEDASHFADWLIEKMKAR